MAVRNPSKPAISNCARKYRATPPGNARRDSAADVNMPWAM